jgi:hypothetical protein
MDASGSDALADIAYGIFEHFLNKELRTRGFLLYQLVESNTPFIEAFNEIFTSFKEVYPDLGKAILTRFHAPADVYTLICNGEGVVPSRTTQMYWILADAPDTEPGQIEDELAGKWLIFIPPEDADRSWSCVRDATVAGELGISAKVSTAKENPESRDSRKVIYIYTADWRDEADVMRVREKLREMGFADRIGYKRNIETFRGEYAGKGKRVTYYSA